MKKFLNLLIVHKPELKGRWWHRLANVLIYGSTIVFLVFGFTILFNFSNFACLSGNKLLTKVLTNAELQENIQTIENSNASQSVINGTIQSYKDLYQQDSDGTWEMKSLHVCFMTNSHDQVIFVEDVLLSILFTFIWFIFWESIIYKAIIYIIYGKNKRE